MVLSSRIGDYKFAGGAANDGESAHQALIREVLEETGMHVKTIGAPLLRTEEYKKDLKNADTSFVMVSDYYPCTLHDTISSQNLDDYEAELGFCPVWITAEDALKANNALSERKDIELPPWLLREIRVLEVFCDTRHPAYSLLKP